jgi:hypothetical protein
MSIPRAPPNHWRTLCQRQNNNTSSIVKGRHTLPEVCRPRLFSPIWERKVDDYNVTRRILQFQPL